MQHRLPQFKSKRLFQLYRRSRFFQLFLHIFGVIFRDAFFYG